MFIVDASILTCFMPSTVGTKITNRATFLGAIGSAVAAHDFTKGTYIHVPEAAPFTLSGVGKRRDNPEHYVRRVWRGEAEDFLKRQYCLDESRDCAVIINTLDDYTADPQVDKVEADRVINMGATHVLVAVLSPPSPLSPKRLMLNLAGGNLAALKWDADTIRAKCVESVKYYDEWSVVAD